MSFLRLLGVWGLVLVGGWGCPATFAQDPVNFDYPRLAHPEIADFLGLNDAQRTEIARLVSEAAERVAQAAEADRGAVQQNYYAQIQAVLSPDQVELLQRLPELRKLKFNFGSPNWEDVLRWFAKQADLSLVMSTPPSGAFNYTDNREYTPAQAIDLLNSILLTKGYTLVRREKLLILVEIKSGVPDEILPRVAFEELDKRGTFEIVSVMFTLGNKPLEVVQAEVQPLLGTYGKIVVLPNSKQLLVTETVGKLRAIGLLIESIPAPAPPPEKEKPAPPIPPILETFPVGSLDAKAIVETLKQLAPNAVVTSDPSARKLVAYGPPAQINIVKEYLAQLQASGSTDGSEPRLQIYPLDASVVVTTPADAAQLLAQLQLVTPEAKISLDSSGKRLLVFGTDAHHVEIQQTLQQLNLADSNATARAVQVFSLQRANPTAVSQMISAVSPRAAVTVDAATSTVVVRTELPELEIIRELVTQMDSAAESQQQLTLKSFPLTRPLSAEFLGVLQSLAPRAKFQPDPQAKVLLVLGNSADLRVLEPLVSQLQSELTPETTPQLASFELTAAEKVKFQALAQTLTTELGALKIIPDAQPNRLTIWAPLETQQFVSKLIEQIQAERENAPAKTLATLPAAVETPTQVTEWLKQKFPDLEFSWNGTNDRLLVWATAEQHPVVAQAVTEWVSQLPPRLEPEYQAYPLQQLDPISIVAMLQPLAPTAKITVDAVNRQLTILATPPDQLKLAAALEKLAAGTPAPLPAIKTYSLEELESAATLALLKSLVPAAQVTLDSATQQLVVIGGEGVQESVRQVLDQLKAGRAEQEQLEIKFYAVDPRWATQATTLLPQLHPLAKVQWDPATQQLSVVAKPREQTRVAQTIERLQQAQPADNATRLVVYPLPDDLRPRFEAALGAAGPAWNRIKILTDNRPGEIAIVATAEEHTGLTEILTQIRQPIAGAEAFEMKTYATGDIEPGQVVEFLQKIFPTVKISPDVAGGRVLIWAAPATHAQIEQALQAVAQPGANPGNTELSLQSYRLQTGKASSLIALLQKLLPRMQLTASDDQGLIVGWGRADDHARLKQAISQINLPDDPKRLSVELYETGEFDPQQAAALLAKMLPDATIIPQTQSGTLTILARGEQHPLVRQTLEQLRPLGQAAGPLQLQVYRVDRTGAAAAVVALTPLVPQAKLIAGATPTQLLVIGSADDQTRIRDWIQTIESESLEIPGMSLRSYRLRADLASQVRPILQTALPSLKLLGAGTDAFAVWAREEDHGRLQQLITEAEQQLQPLPKTYRSYDLDGLTAAQARGALASQIPTLAYVETGALQTLTVLGTEQEHQQIERLLVDLRGAIPSPPQREVATIPIPDTSLTMLLESLPEPLKSRAQLKPDLDSNSLIVIAEAEVLAEVREAVATLQTQLPKLDRPYPQIYAVPGLTAKDWQALILQLAPTAVVSTDSRSGALVVTARSSVHQRLSEAIKSFQDTLSVDHSIQVYPVTRGDLQVTLQALLVVVPNAKLTADTTARSILAVASAADHEVIRTALSQIDQPLTRAVVSQAYPVPSGDAVALATALRALIPAGVYVPDASGKTLLAVALPDEHASLKTTIEQWTSDPTRQLSSQVYTLQRADPTAAVAVLQKLVPGATLAADKGSNSIAATATVDQHALLAKALKEFDQPDLAPISKVYPAQGLPAKDWQALIAQLAPGAVVATDPATNSLIITARPAVHDVLGQLVQELEKNLSSGKTAQAYRLNRADVTAAATALSTLLPNASVTPDRIGKTLIVVASEADQATAATTIEQLDNNASMAAVAQVYPIPSADATALATALKTLVPTGSYVADATGKSLLVMATEDEQRQIRATVEQWTSDPARQLSSQVYTLQRADPTAAVAVLQKLVPGATLAADKVSNSIAATATVDQHALLAKALKEFDQPDLAPISKVYPAQGLPAKDWQALVTQLAPGAVVATDPATNSLIITARPAVHDVLGQLVQELEKNLSAGKTAQAYRLTRADVTAAATALSTLLPNASVTPDRIGKTLIVVASEADQATAATTIEQLDNNASMAAVAQVYPIPSADATALATALKTLVPTGSYVADATGKSLLVMATEDEQRQIRATVEQWGGDPSRQLTSQVYPFERADPQTAATALQKMLPGATLAVDANTRSLVATATGEQHQAIQQTVVALESVGEKSGNLELRSYLVTRAPAESLAKALKDLFKADTQVSVAAEKDSRTLIAVARPYQHAMIEALVEKAELGLSTTERVLQTYPLTRSDGKTFVDSLTKLFERDPVVPQLSFDSSGQRLLALASPEQHRLIGQTLKELAGAPQEFELFRLQTVDVQTADTALESVFRDEPRTSAPSIDVDYDNQALLVRASPQQLEKIRATLVRLGEVNLDASSSIPATENLRIIPWPNSQRPPNWDQLQQLWPQLRKNELRILPSDRPGEPTDSSGAADSELPVSVADSSPQADEPPVLIVPEQDRLILASQDPVALQQLESLLRIMMRTESTLPDNRNYQIFSLKNAGAGEVADLLKDLFKQMGNSRRMIGGTPLVISADERLNLLIVHGSRSDREVVAELMPTLDSAEMPDRLSLNQPLIVPVRNTDANRLLTILNSLYRNQLTSGGGRKQIAIPEGIAPEVASMLQQVNTATAGPVLTLGVDALTNSIIVMAPQILREQVRGVIEQLDNAVETEPGEAVKIIRLPDSNPARIQKALDLLLNEKKK